MQEGTSQNTKRRNTERFLEILHFFESCSLFYYGFLYWIHQTWRQRLKTKVKGFGG